MADDRRADVTARRAARGGSTPGIHRVPRIAASVRLMSRAVTTGGGSVGETANPGIVRDESKQTRHVSGCSLTARFVRGSIIVAIGLAQFPGSETSLRE